MAAFAAIANSPLPTVTTTVSISDHGFSSFSDAPVTPAAPET